MVFNIFTSVLDTEKKEAVIKYISDTNLHNYLYI